ncbi:MAG: cobalamin-dependent protein, partial [Clostridia bacterium]|nr:cobalamin-dependent protein [Clostridia bacterium]
MYNKLSEYDVIAFSCYIWNIEIVKKLIEMLNDKILILGGPEVSYNAKTYLECGVSYVIKNEGEEAFDMLLKYLDNKCAIEDVPNLYHKNGFTFDKLVDLNKTKMAYDLLDDIQNKIVYLETSRGCPYKCAYCMASLDNKLRFFNI